MQIRFASIWPWWIIVAVALVGSFAIVLWYWRESKQNAGGHALLLASLRGIAFFLMIAMLLRPYLEYNWTDGDLSRLRIIIDTSRSMQIEDEPSAEAPNSTVSRITRVQQELQKSSIGRENLLERLARQHRVEMLNLKGQLIWDSELSKTLPTDWELPADQPNTPLGEILLAQIRSGLLDDEPIDTPKTPRKSIDAMVLISDGQNNSEIDPVDLLSQNSNVAFPIYTVAAGQSQEPVDLGILSVTVSEKVRKEDRLRGSIQIKEECPAGTKYRVHIQHNGTIIYSEQLTALSQGVRDFKFDFPALEAFELAKSQFRGAEATRRAIPIDLECEIIASPELSELTLANNRRMSSTWGVTRENKILILDPRGRWETRYIRNALERDPNWDLASRLGQSDFEKVSVLDSNDSLSPFDLVILTREAAKSFDDNQSQWLRDFVSQTGGGLIWIDSSRLETNLPEIWREILPFRENGDSEVAYFPSPWNSQGSLRLLAIAESEPALQLASDDTNLSVWEGLAGPRSAMIHKPKPGSEILIEFKAANIASNASNAKEEWYPFMITARFGQGRVIAIASDESWRWRYNVADLYHQRFWNQLSNWCMRPPFVVADDFLALDAGNRVYSLSESVVIRARLLNDNQLPIENGSVRAVLSQDGVAMARIDMIEQSESGGVYQGVYRDLGALSQVSSFDSSKEIMVSIEASGVPWEALKTKTSFRVDPSIDIESSKLASHTERLASIASKTKAESLRLESLERIEELLATHKRGVRRFERLSLAESYYWLGAIMTVLAMEWILRKRHGLV